MLVKSIERVVLKDIAFSVTLLALTINPFLGPFASGESEIAMLHRVISKEGYTISYETLVYDMFVLLLYTLFILRYKECIIKITKRIWLAILFTIILFAIPETEIISPLGLMLHKGVIDIFKEFIFSRKRKIKHHLYSLGYFKKYS